MKLTEKTIFSETKFEGKIIKVKRDEVLMPDGSSSYREIVEHNGGVCIAPLTDNDTLIFVRQFRYAYGEEILELPAGKLEKCEDPKSAGIRELSEETGYTSRRVESLGVIYPTPGYCNEKIYLYLARDLEKFDQHLDDGEFLTLEEMSLEKALDMVMNGEIKDAKTQIIILKIAKILGM